MIENLMKNSYAVPAALSLLHFLWQGVLLGAVAALARRSLARSSPQSRYLAGCVFLTAMAIAPLATFVFLRSELPSAASSNPQTISIPALIPEPQGIAGPNAGWLPFVLALWLAGVLLFALRAAGGWSLALYQLSVHRRLADRGVRASVQQISSRLGIRRAIRVFESTRALVPSVFGVIRPVIVLPASAVTGLPPSHLDAILAHELAHIARQDFLANCLQSAVEVLLFYHPAVWWLSRCIREDREMCCDAIAANICGDRVMYSRALLALEENRQEFALAATGGNLKSRIEHLLGPVAETTSTAPMPLLLVSLLVVAAEAMMLAQPKPPASGSPYDRWANQDVVYIMPEEERKAWERLTSDDEREQFIVQFWQRRDPVPATPENEMKEEHYRRIAYANDRFGDWRPGWTTARGRIYILYGPPNEIESHPRELRESWLYKLGPLFEFTGQAYDLKPGGTGRVMERITVDRLPEPQRTHLRNRLAEFVGKPMSDDVLANDLMERIRAAASEIDRRLTYTWRMDPVTRQISLELSYDQLP